jgi:hypothetical protein
MGVEVVGDELTTEQEKGELAITLAVLHGMKCDRSAHASNRWYTDQGTSCPVLKRQRDSTGFYYFESQVGLALAYCGYHGISLEHPDDGTGEG